MQKTAEIWLFTSPWEFYKATKAISRDWVLIIALTGNKIKVLLRLMVFSFLSMLNQFYFNGLIRDYAASNSHNIKQALVWG